MKNLEKLKKDAAAQLAEQFRMNRAKLQMTQDQVADQAGISRLTYSGIERGTTNPSRDTIVAIASVLKCKINFTFTDIQ